MKIRGLQITAGTIIKYVENIMYVKNFREMTVDTTEGSWVVTEKDLLDLVRNMDNKDKDINKKIKSVITGDKRSVSI